MSYGSNFLSSGGTCLGGELYGIVPSSSGSEDVGGLTEGGSDGGGGYHAGFFLFPKSRLAYFDEPDGALSYLEKIVNQQYVTPNQPNTYPTFTYGSRY